MITATETPYTAAFRLSDSGNDAVDIVIEPWIAELRVQPGSVLDVAGWSADPGVFEWDEPNGVLFGWSRSEARASVDGSEVWKSFAPCPGLPVGLSMAGFFGVVGNFKDEGDQ